MDCPFRPCLVSFVVAVHYSTLLSTAGGPIRITRVACSPPAGLIAPGTKKMHLMCHGHCVTCPLTLSQSRPDLARKGTLHTRRLPSEAEH